MAKVGITESIRQIQNEEAGQYGIAIERGDANKDAVLDPVRAAAIRQGKSTAVDQSAYFKQDTGDGYQISGTDSNQNPQGVYPSNMKGAK